MYVGVSITSTFYYMHNTSLYVCSDLLLNEFIFFDPCVLIYVTFSDNIPTYMRTVSCICVSLLLPLSLPLSISVPAIS